MQIVVRCTEALRQELLQQGLQQAVQPVWVFEKSHFLNYPAAAAFIDLLFENEEENLRILQQCRGVKIISSVVHTLGQTDTSFVRINGWATFLKSHAIEGSCRHEDLKKLAAHVFAGFNKTIEWLPDTPGFVVPRVVSLIVSEAYFALAEGVSTREEIDLAMKLGTAYPFGPFEWSEQIGAKNIATLLTTLSEQEARYKPAPLLLQHAAAI
jgi:3-hydroxybutyryl-CoA dehydrogenase